MNNILNFIIGGAKTGKSSELMKRISGSFEDKQDIFVIIPDQYSFEFDKKLYNELGAVKYNKILVFSFSRIADEIFRLFGGKMGVYAEDYVKICLMSQAIAFAKKADKLKYFRKQSETKGFIKLMLNIVKEFGWSCITPENLLNKLQFLSENLQEKVSEIALIYTYYLNMMESSGYKDNLTNIVDAARIASKNGYFAGKTVFIDEFQSFSADELEMLKVVIRDSKEVNITISMDENSKLPLFSIQSDTCGKLCEIARECGTKISKKTLNVPLGFISNEIQILSQNIFHPQHISFENGENIQVFELNDIYVEVDFICSEIRRLVIEKNYKYKEIVIITGQVENYISVFESSCARYEIPYYEDNSCSIMHKPIILLIKSLFEITSKKTLNTEEILRYLKTNLVGIDRNDVFLLENFCYKWNVDGDVWLDDFPENDEENSINILRKRTIEPIIDFQNEITQATGGDICKALMNFFVKISLEKNILNICDFTITDVRILEIYRELIQIWNIVTEILDSMYESLKDAVISIHEFYEILMVILSDVSIAVPPQTLDAVTIASTDRAKLVNPKVVFVVGCNEGKFPFVPKVGGLLSDMDKSKLDNIGIKMSITVKHCIAQERFSAYSALSSASEQVYICYPLSDAAGNSMKPSYIIAQICKLFSNKLVKKLDDSGKSILCNTLKSSYYNFVEGYSKQSVEMVTLKCFLQEMPFYAKKIEFLEQIALLQQHKIPDKRVTRSLFGESFTISASRFEDYCKCPFIYFCKKGLQVYPQRKVEINSIEEGNIIHDCLRNVFVNFNKKQFISASEEELALVISSTLDRYYLERLGGKFCKTYRFNALYNRLLGVILEVLTYVQDEMGQSDFIPTDFEAKISKYGKIKPIILKNSDGIEINFVGIIDRIDTLIDGESTYVRVIDYKTGEKIFALDDLIYGINMQMFLYLFSITDNCNSAAYKNSLAAGVLYMPAKEISGELGRNSTDLDAQKYKRKSFKMSGIIVEEERVIKAMEKNMEGVYIPVKKLTEKSEKINEKFTKSSSLITTNQLGNLKSYANSLLIGMADELYNGNISAKPLKIGNLNPCDYCDYWSICGSFNEFSAKDGIYDRHGEILKILDGADKNAKDMDRTTVSGN